MQKKDTSSVPGGKDKKHKMNPRAGKDEEDGKEEDNVFFQMRLPTRYHSDVGYCATCQTRLSWTRYSQG
jgi:hypothetical protein